MGKIYWKKNLNLALSLEYLALLLFIGFSLKLVNFSGE